MFPASAGEPGPLQHLGHQPEPATGPEGAAALADSAPAEEAGDEHSSAAGSHRSAGRAAG